MKHKIMKPKKQFVNYKQYDRRECFAMSKSNLAVKEEISDIVGEEAILQEPTPNNVRPIKKEKTKTNKAGRSPR